MEDTWVFDIRNPQIREIERAIGYKKNMKRRDDYVLLTTGDGGIYSTIEDMFAWDQALYDNNFISQATLEEAYQPVTLPNGVTKNYGFGWVIGSNLNGKVVTHSGGLAGFRNYFERQIEVRNTLIILSNNSNDDIVEIRNILVKILDGRPYEMPEN
jgi:CubicO group peptidase (beta-lactamase class C family)